MHKLFVLSASKMVNILNYTHIYIHIKSSKKLKNNIRKNLKHKK